MKKKLLILTILFSGCLWAQETQVNLYGGYVFDDSFDSYFDANDYYEGKIEGGFQWGLGFEYLPSPRAGIELLYLRQDTNVPAVFLNGFLSEVERVNFDLGLNYLMLGGAHYLTSPDTPLEPFVGLMAGMVFGKLTNPENGNEENFTKFAWGLKA